MYRNPKFATGLAVLVAGLSSQSSSAWIVPGAVHSRRPQPTGTTGKIRGYHGGYHMSIPEESEATATSDDTEVLSTESDDEILQSPKSLAPWIDDEESEPKAKGVNSIAPWMDDGESVPPKLNVPKTPKKEIPDGPGVDIPEKSLVESKEDSKPELSIDEETAPSAVNGAATPNTVAGFPSKPMSGSIPVPKMPFPPKGQATKMPSFGSGAPKMKFGSVKGVTKLETKPKDATPPPAIKELPKPKAAFKFPKMPIGDATQSTLPPKGASAKIPSFGKTETSKEVEPGKVPDETDAAEAVSTEEPTTPANSKETSERKAAVGFPGGPPTGSVPGNKLPFPPQGQAAKIPSFGSAAPKMKFGSVKGVTGVESKPKDATTAKGVAKPKGPFAFPKMPAGASNKFPPKAVITNTPPIVKTEAKTEPEPANAPTEIEGEALSDEKPTKPSAVKDTTTPKVPADFPGTPSIGSMPGNKLQFPPKGQAPKMPSSGTASPKNKIGSIKGVTQAASAPKDATPSPPVMKEIVKPKGAAKFPTIPTGDSSTDNKFKFPHKGVASKAPPFGKVEAEEEAELAKDPDETDAAPIATDKPTMPATVIGTPAPKIAGGFPGKPAPGTMQGKQVQFPPKGQAAKMPSFGTAAPKTKVGSVKGMTQLEAKPKDSTTAPPTMKGIPKPKGAVAFLKMPTTDSNENKVKFPPAGIAAKTPPAGAAEGNKESEAVEASDQADPKSTSTDKTLSPTTIKATTAPKAAVGLPEQPTAGTVQAKKFQFPPKGQAPKMPSFGTIPPMNKIGTVKGMAQVESKPKDATLPPPAVKEIPKAKGVVKLPNMPLGASKKEDKIQFPLKGVSPKTPPLGQPEAKTETETAKVSDDMEKKAMPTDKPIASTPTKETHMGFPGKPEAGPPQVNPSQVPQKGIAPKIPSFGTPAPKNKIGSVKGVAQVGPKPKESTATPPAIKEIPRPKVAAKFPKMPMGDSKQETKLEVAAQGAGSRPPTLGKLEPKEAAAPAGAPTETETQEEATVPSERADVQRDGAEAEATLTMKKSTEAEDKQKAAEAISSMVKMYEVPEPDPLSLAVSAGREEGRPLSRPKEAEVDPAFNKDEQAEADARSTAAELVSEKAADFVTMYEVPEPDPLSLAVSAGREEGCPNEDVPDGTLNREELEEAEVSKTTAEVGPEQTAAANMVKLYEVPEPDPLSLAVSAGREEGRPKEDASEATLDRSEMTEAAAPRSTSDAASEQAAGAVKMYEVPEADPLSLAVSAGREEGLPKEDETEITIDRTELTEAEAPRSSREAVSEQAADMVKLYEVPEPDPLSLAVSAGKEEGRPKEEEEVEASINTSELPEAEASNDSIKAVSERVADMVKLYEVPNPDPLALAVSAGREAGHEIEEMVKEAEKEASTREANIKTSGVEDNEARDKAQQDARREVEKMASLIRQKDESDGSAVQERGSSTAEEILSQTADMVTLFEVRKPVPLETGYQIGVDTKMTARQEARRLIEEQARIRALEKESERKLKEDSLNRAKTAKAARRQESQARQNVEEEARQQAMEERLRNTAAQAIRRAEAKDRLKAHEEARLKEKETGRVKALELWAKRKADMEAALEEKERAEAESREQGRQIARRLNAEAARINAEKEEAAKQASQRRTRDAMARIEAEREARRRAEAETRNQANEEARLLWRERVRIEAEAEEMKKQAEIEARMKGREAAKNLLAKRRAEDEARLAEQNMADSEMRKRARQEASRLLEENARLRAEAEQAKERRLERLWQEKLF